MTDPDLARVRRIHRTIEPYHSIVYFSRAASTIYEQCGLTGASGYFASRSAALGAVPTPVVTATFFNFAPPLVEKAMEGVWEQTTPTEVLQARLEVVDRTLRDHLDDAVISSDQLADAARTARQVATEAAALCEGRALFAAHTALDWPDAPHLMLWHAATLLREFRGDAHIAALVTSGLDGLDAIVIHAASRKVPSAFLRATRGWDDTAWNGAVELHRESGWLARENGPDGEPVLSEAGTAMREEIEIATDRASAMPWTTLDADQIEHLREVIRPWARTLSDAMFSGFGG